MKLSMWAALAAMSWAGSAAAESVRLTGKFAAGHREAAQLRSLGIDRFAGRDGGALEMAIERSLAQPDIDGRPHFEMVGAFGGVPGPEGVLSGNVSSGVQENRFKRKEKQCVEKDGNGKCLREAEVEIDCTRRVIDLNADLRLVRRGDGRVVYSTAKPRRDESSWCRGQNPQRTVEEAVRGMILDIAGEVRRDIAPRIEDYSVRFRESTSGLPKEFNRPFKDIVKQTQRDLRGACAAWTAMDAQAPNHPSIVFDLGLCAEASGDLPAALALYRRAATLIGRGTNEATAGADRVSSLMAAQEDDAARRR